MLVVQTETIVFFLGNEIKFSSAVLIFDSTSMVTLLLGLLSPRPSPKKKRVRILRNGLKTTASNIQALRCFCTHVPQNYDGQLVLFYGV